jgi:hypothetical protein
MWPERKKIFRGLIFFPNRPQKKFRAITFLVAQIIDTFLVNFLLALLTGDNHVDNITKITIIIIIPIIAIENIIPLHYS